MKAGIFIKLVLFCNIALLSSCSINKTFNGNNIAQLSPVDYQAKLQDISETERYIIDVRTPMEYKGGFIEGAQNISYIGTGFSNKIAQLDTTKMVFLYCQTAHRSPLATKKLMKHGFTNIYDLAGGMKAWKKAGYEVENAKED